MGMAVVGVAKLLLGISSRKQELKIETKKRDTCLMVRESCTWCRWNKHSVSVYRKYFNSNYGKRCIVNENDIKVVGFYVDIGHKD